MASEPDKVASIKRLYYRTTRATIDRDLARAVEILRSMTTETERERAAAFMDGLSQLRSDWRAAGEPSPPAPRHSKRRPSRSTR
jgi:hypothetical protein